jgi:hypothetical protein
MEAASTSATSQASAWLYGVITHMTIIWTVSCCYEFFVIDIYVIASYRNLGEGRTNWSACAPSREGPIRQEIYVDMRELVRDEREVSVRCVLQMFTYVWMGKLIWT